MPDYGIAQRPNGTSYDVVHWVLAFQPRPAGITLDYFAVVCRATWLFGQILADVPPGKRLCKRCFPQGVSGA